MDFSNRNILITGAADGLGFAVSKAFSEKKIRPSVQPSVNIDKYEEGDDLVLNVIIQKMPEVGDVDLKKISLENFD